MLQLDLFGLGNDPQPVKAEQEPAPVAAANASETIVHKAVEEPKKPMFEQRGLFDSLPVATPELETAQAETPVNNATEIPVAAQQPPAVVALPVNAVDPSIPSNTVVFADSKISVKIKWKPLVPPAQPIVAAAEEPGATQANEEAAASTAAEAQQTETHLASEEPVAQPIAAVMQQSLPETTAPVEPEITAEEAVMPVTSADTAEVHTIMDIAAETMETFAATAVPGTEAVTTTAEAAAAAEETTTAETTETETESSTEQAEEATSVIAQQPWHETDAAPAARITPAADTEKWQWQPATVAKAIPEPAGASVSKSKRPAKKKTSPDTPVRVAGDDARVTDFVTPGETGPKKRGRKSFREIDAEVDMVNVPDDDELYEKQYYPISTVAAWFNVNTSLLRYWENEFDILRPRKNKKGDRLFRPEDIKNLQVIYHLLRQRKFTIEGAKEYLKGNKKKADTHTQLVYSLTRLRSFLLELKANLS